MKNDSSIERMIKRFTSWVRGDSAYSWRNVLAARANTVARRLGAQV